MRKATRAYSPLPRFKLLPAGWAYPNGFHAHVLNIYCKQRYKKRGMAQKEKFRTMSLSVNGVPTHTLTTRPLRRAEQATRSSLVE